ncbi:MAG: serine hydrolase [Bacteroidetes bacterium]|nr:serine hydrolase [Bacteroidota bacterium]
MNLVLRFAFTTKGEKVVDLWGGFKDKNRKLPWKDDTMIIVFSTTKECLAWLWVYCILEAFFDYDDKVSSYWPNFQKMVRKISLSGPYYLTKQDFAELIEFYV